MISKGTILNLWDSETDPVFIQRTDWSVEREGYGARGQQGSGRLHHIQCGPIGVQEGKGPTNTRGGHPSLQILNLSSQILTRFYLTYCALFPSSSIENVFPAAWLTAL